MKLKEIDRTASVAWSPVQLDNIYLAAGTAAQQLDSSFSTNAALEIYQLNVSEPGLDIPVKATYTCESRFHKIVWGSHAIGEEKNEYPSGIIVGGCDGGVMQVYNANKLFQNEDPVILTKTKHAGPVKALDFNSFRSNLIASGASDSEIFIWDLNNPKVPMSPGAKIQPADDVTDLEWNKQVEHILATTFPARCVVWDLRKNEPVIKVSDSTSRIRYKCVRWHPEVATQMCLASEDDASPVIQLWDLRYATSPLKVIQGHQRGILGMSWCPQDPELLLSCGKDSRILCCNPNYAHPGYENVLEIPTASQWTFEVSFCPRNPMVMSSCSFEGRINVYGLAGGAQLPVTSSKLADSFPGMDMTIQNAPVPSQTTTIQQLREPPKWMKTPSGVKFAFGGRLVSFQNVKTPSTQPGQPDKISGTVNISQIVTLPSFIERSKKLEEALQTGFLEHYCAEKARTIDESNEARVWEFLQASFSQNPRQAFVSLLGFNTAGIITKLQETIQTNDLDSLASEFDDLGRQNKQGGESLDSFAGLQNGFDQIPEIEKIVEFSVPTDESVDGKINQALLCGSIEVAVYLCLENERWADAFLLAAKGSPELMTKAQAKYFKKCKGKSTNMIRAVVRNDLDHLVSNCELESWKQVLATVLTYADEAKFKTVTETLGQRLLESRNNNLAQGALLCFICSGSLNQLVDARVGSSEKFSSPDELQDLVEQVMILKKAAEMWGRQVNLAGGALAGKLIEYASILASQGCLDTALSYLKDSNDPSIITLKERLQLSLGYARPTRSQIGPRSRQSSESSTSGLRSLHKRPSHPSAPVKRGSDIYQPTDFSNLSGPVQPPSNPYNASGAYNSGYGQPSQFSPAPVSTTPGLISSYGGTTATVNPFPPAAASAVATPPTLFNPAEAAAAAINTPAAHEPLQRKISGGSMPRPPVSNVASGWNDPPPIISKPKTQQQVAKQQMPELYQPTNFTNTIGSAQPPSSAFNPGYAASSQYTAPTLNTQGMHSYNQPGSVNSISTGLPPKPPGAHIGAPSSFYNPMDAAGQRSEAPTMGQDALHHNSMGASSHPPASAPGGWNDPPPFLIKQKPAPSPQLMSQPPAPRPDLFQPASFSNVTGPPQPPSSYAPPPPTAYNAVYGVPSQYSPAPPAGPPGLLTHAQPGMPGAFSAGLPPPPTAAMPGPPPSMYNSVR